MQKESIIHGALSSFLRWTNQGFFSKPGTEAGAMQGQARLLQGTPQNTKLELPADLSLGLSAPLYPRPVGMCELKEQKGGRDGEVACLVCVV